MSARAKEYFFLKQCPLHKQCADANKKPKLWGWDLEEAMASVRHHLTQSSKHYLEEDAAQELIDQATFQQDSMDVTSDEEAEPADQADLEVKQEQPPAPKKVRLQPAAAAANTAPCSASSIGAVLKAIAGAGSTEQTNAALRAISATVARTVRETMASAAATGASAPVPAATLAPAPAPLFGAPFLLAVGNTGMGEDNITVSRARLQSMIDAVDRASRAARQAQHLSQTAANQARLLGESAQRAFQAEADSLDRCRDYLQSLQ